MTTKVLIVNHGPLPVLVSVIDATDRTKDAHRQQVVQPTESRAEYVHGTDSVLIEEVER